MARSLIEVRNEIAYNEPHLETTSGNIASFSTDMCSPLKELKVHFYCQQSGSGTPSPTNIRPLSGWSGLDVWRVGRNLFDKDSMVDRSQTCYINESGNIVSNHNWYITDWIPVEGTTVTISGVGGNAPAIALYDENKNFLVGHRYGTSTADIKTSITLTASQDAYYCRFSIYYRDDYADLIKLELGSSATDYEPFVGTKNSVLFPSSAGTVYGGYVDLIRGKLVAEWVSAKIGDMKVQLNNNLNTAWSNWHIQPTVTGYPHPKYGQGTYDVIAISDSFDADRRGLTQTTEKAIIWTSTSNVLDQIRIKYRADCALSSAEFKEKYADARIAYMVQTPIEYDIDPVTLKTLRGVNNIWSNSNGEVEVKFWTH